MRADTHIHQPEHTCTNVNKDMHAYINAPNIVREVERREPEVIEPRRAPGTKIFLFIRPISNFFSHLHQNQKNFELLFYMYIIYTPTSMVSQVCPGSSHRTGLGAAYPLTPVSIALNIVMSSGSHDYL